MIDTILIGEKTATAYALPPVDYPRWRSIVSVVAGMTTATPWWLADALAAGIAQHGEQAYAEMEALTRLKAGTLKLLADTATHVAPERRLDALTFSHHRQVRHLDAVEQTRWLTQARDQAWSVRALAGYMRDAGLTHERRTDPVRRVLAIIETMSAEERERCLDQLAQLYPDFECGEPGTEEGHRVGHRQHRAERRRDARLPDVSRRPLHRGGHGGGDAIMPYDAPRICMCTDPGHVENCPDCLGFGHTAGTPHQLGAWGEPFVSWGTFPRGSRDCDNPDAYARPCPSCRTGVPRYWTRKRKFTRRYRRAVTLAALQALVGTAVGEPRDTVEEAAHGD